jgi:ABC-type lipoprotein release transport system permease subunit
MPAVWMVVRALVRRRLGATLALVVLVGLAGGVVLAAAAGAHRTASAYPRLLDHLNIPDLAFVPEDGRLDVDALERLPQVDAVGRADGYYMAAPGAGGVPDIDNGPYAVASVDGRALLEVGRPLVVSGRLPRPGRADEVFLSERGVDVYRARLGEKVRFFLVRPDELQARQEQLAAEGREPTAADAADLFTPIDLTVVGTGRLETDIVTDENQRDPAAFFGPAFARAHGDAVGYRGAFVELRDAGDVAEFQRALRRLRPDTSFSFVTRESSANTVSQAVRPYRDALVLFAVLAGLTSFLVVGQAVARQVVVDRDEVAALRGLGMTGRGLLAASAGRAAAVGVGGAALAVVLAWSVSARFPIGPARLAEPDPGLSLDVTVIAIGIAAIVVLVVGRGLVAAWRAGARSPTAAWGRGGSTAAAAVERAGLPVPAATGIRLAFAPVTTVSAARTATMTGLVAAIACVLAALSFGASLDRLVTTPAAYGWTWDALGDTFDEEADRALVRQVAQDPDIERYTVGARGDLTIEGEAVSSFGFEPRRGTLLPAVTAGRFPERRDEIALGADTLRRLGRSVGERVRVGRGGGGDATLTIVGRVVLPSLALNQTYGLADAAALTVEGLRAVDPGSRQSFFLVDVVGGQAKIAALDRRYSDLSLSFAGPQRPGDIESYDGVRATPVVLAALLAALGAGTLAHALLATVRSERRALAVLECIGFTRGQVSAAVAWQATAFVLLAAIIAVPLGIAAGRWTWTVFAERLGLPAGPVVSVVAVAAVVAGAFVVSGLVALAPAWMAARTRPATVLRTE